MAILYVGIDLAKNVFALHGVDEAGKPALVRPSVPRAKLLELIAALPPCVIGMGACFGAHHWARLFQGLGHTVRLMAPKFVIPYRLSGRRGKNDAADAAAICEGSIHLLIAPARCSWQLKSLTHTSPWHGFARRQSTSPPSQSRKQQKVIQQPTRDQLSAAYPTLGKTWL